MTQFENQIRLDKQKISLRSDNQEIPESMIFLGNIMEIIKDQKSIESMELIIEQEFASAKFASFSETEQNEVLLMLAVFLDSMGYWSDNLADWLNMSNTNNFRSQIDDIYIDLTNEDNWKTFVITAVCDMIGGNTGGAAGAISTGTVGAIGGAIGGLFAGGIGAGPGAMVGGVGGAVGGGFVGFVAGAINASSGCVTAYGNEDEDLYKELYKVLFY